MNEHKEKKEHRHYEKRETTEFKPRKNVSSIMEAREGDYLKATVRIERVSKPGPTIFVVSDGYGMVDAVTKDSDLKLNDVVELEGEVNERAGKLQVEIRHIKKVDMDFESLVTQKSKPFDKPVSIQSERYKKLRSYFYAIAWEMRKAIIENKPIIIRHHADADGITAGICLEQACKLVMKEIGANPEYNLYRSPSKAPFYETSDMLRDVSWSKKLVGVHGQKKPLIIVTDNGSTPEDVFAMKSLKLLGFDIIVIDHHNPVELENKKTAVCKYLKLHLNPYIEGYDGQTSAGMLCYEVARLIHKDFDNKLLPAISAIGDRCVIAEAENYIAQSGLSKDELQKKVIAIDFLSYHLRFDEASGIYEEVFKNDDFVDMLNEEVRQGVETQLQSALPYLRTQDINGVTFSYIDLEKYTLKFTYPTPGKVTGMIHDEVAVGKENMPVITLGYLSDMIIIRATKPILPVAEIIKKLRHDIPEASVDGGGHECAGTIKFVSAHLTTILESIKQQIRNIDYREKKEQEE